MITRLVILSISIITCQFLQAQDSLPAATQPIPSKYLEQVSAKAKGIEQKADKKSQKALAQLQKQEEKIRRKLSRIDSAAANTIFNGAGRQYEELKQKIKLNGKFTQYLPHLDSVATSLPFLQQNPQLLSHVKEAKQKLHDAITRVEALKNQLQKAEDIKQFLKERKQYLKEQLEKFGLTRQLKKINKQVYYYAQQINEYKEIINDPQKAEKKAIELLSKTKFFQYFMRRNSMLASLFRLPGQDDPSSAGGTALAGLQTRASVNALIQNQLAAGGPNAQNIFQQNIQAAQAQLNGLKDKALKFGGGSSDAVMPEGFKPNNQKTKSFLKRLEYGADVQTQKATNFFPVTSDIGLSLGYKLNDKSVIGIGASYKLGWGRGWNNISITTQGLGLRSFIDYKLKSNLFICGGYEQNYKTALRGITLLSTPWRGAGGEGWQQSGLIGVSKKIAIKTKFFTKTTVKLLWDFLSYQQVPRTQPVIFRIGYNIK